MIDSTAINSNSYCSAKCVSKSLSCEYDDTSTSDKISSGADDKPTIIVFLFILECCLTKAIGVVRLAVLAYLGRM
jgi:hypothetical protein